MADITKCANEGCPIKSTCYRHTAPDSIPWQSYAHFVYINHMEGTGHCDNYWPNETNDKTGTDDATR